MDTSTEHRDHNHAPSAGAHAHGSHGDHAAHAGHDPDVFRRKFWLTLLLTVPIVVTSEMVMDWFGYELDFTGRSLVGPVLGSIVFWWGGWPFLSGAVDEARARRPGMMLLIAMAISVAYVASMLTTFEVLDLDFWWELATLVTIMLLGHWQEMRAIGQAQGALAALAALLPDEADRVGGDGRLQTVPVSELASGDVVLVRSGGRVPADGVVVEGAADVDESMVTGESRPVSRAVGDPVVAGTVSTNAPIRVRVEAVGENTALAGIQRLVAEAQASQSRAQAVADRFAAALFYVATATGLATFVVWSVVDDVGTAIERTVTVLVIACPHALGLAIPLVVSLATAVAARAGILVKDRLALERMRTVDVVLFDKTGTLTRGEHVVTGVAAVPELDEGAVLAVAAAVEGDSEHPLARAIVRAARERGLVVPTAGGSSSTTGVGASAVVAGAAHHAGGRELLRRFQLEIPDVLRPAVAEWEARGASVVVLVREEEKVLGALALEDEIRPEARDAVDELVRLGRRVAMVTGDSRAVAEAVARELGIDEVFAEVLPDQKDAVVSQLQERRDPVAMVGDGVNDAPALARADVGLAIGAGTDVAIESADVVLVSSDPRGVVGTIRLSIAAYRKMIQNLAWAAGYNVIALPLAAGVLAGIGIAVSPAVGAILMSASTIVVAANAQLLRRLDLSRD
jgi:P-type Cu2+ transporter